MICTIIDIAYLVPIWKGMDRWIGLYFRLF